MTRRRQLVPAVVLAVALLGGACTDGDDGDDAAPTSSTTPEEATTTTIVDYSGVFLAPVRGETTTTVLATGSMVLRGTVRGPGGAVGGATVRIERILPSGTAQATDVAADGSGRYELRGVPGGRYRIRAFQPPSLLQDEPLIEFLSEREEHEIDLDVEQVGGLVLTAAAAPRPPTLGNPVNVVVQVAVRQVDTDGVVRGTPQVGVPVELSGLGSWVPRGSGDASSRSITATTDAGGRARFSLQCARTGDPGLSAGVPVSAGAPPGGAPTVTSHVERLDLPSCVDPSASTTTTDAPSSSATPSTSSSTSSSTVAPDG